MLKKIVIAHHSLISNSGISNIVVNTANHLIKSGIYTSIITLVSNRKDTNKNLKVLKPIPKGGSLLFRSKVFNPFIKHLLERMIDKIKPQIVDVYYPPFDSFFLSLRDKYKFKVVYHYHSVTEPSLYSGYDKNRREIEEALTIENLKRSDLVISISEFVKNKIYDKYKINSIFVPDGIDLDFFKPDKCSLKLNHPAFLHTGRIVKHKGIHLLISAFKLVLEKEPNAHLYIIGKQENDEYFKSIKKQAEELKNVHLIGETNDETLLNYYRGADVFSCASLYEGFGLPFLEAQACGLPCVGFNVCSIPEVVSNNQTGILVEKENIHQFSNAMLTLISNDDMRKKMGRAGIENANRFNYKTIIQKLLEIYNELV